MTHRAEIVNNVMQNKVPAFRHFLVRVWPYSNRRMVVCKFFQQGNCRYGQNCRFDHVYGSKFSYHAAPSQPVSQPKGITDEQLVNQVQTDVQAVLIGGQWILSCYSPLKEKPNFPGLSDLSMEEARLFIYEAKASNNLDQAVSYMNNLFQESRSKYEQLLQPNMAIVKVLRSLYNGEVTASPFSSNTQNSGFATNSSSASSIFRSAVQGPGTFGQQTNTNDSSIFGQNPSNANASVFGQNVFNQANPGSVFEQKPNSVFGSPNTETAAKSVFAQASQNIFGPSQPTNTFGNTPNQNTNVFGNVQSDTSAKSVFAQANQNVFGNNQAPSNPATVFANATPSVFATSPFSPQNCPSTTQQNSMPFGNSTPNIFHTSGKNPNDQNIYSDENMLSPTDIEAFKGDDFKLGFVPEIPPPYSLCF